MKKPLISEREFALVILFTTLFLSDEQTTYELMELVVKEVIKVWQDVLLMVGGFIFSIALIPSLRGKNKPEAMTSIVTAITLTAFCVAYASLHLWMAFGSTWLTATLWGALAAQRLRQSH